MSLYEVTAMIAELSRRHKKGGGAMAADKYDDLRQKLGGVAWAKVN